VVVPAPSGHFDALATRSDAIRPIYHPRFVQASGTGLFPGDLVIGVAIGDAARAYPVAYLTEREMVDDRIGHTPFVVTWCPVCYSAVVFDRRIGRRTYLFGNNSRLYMRNLTMWDHQTGTIWSQLDGRGILGRLKGTRLRMMPDTVETWRSWRSSHPDTKVLQVPSGFHTVITNSNFVIGVSLGKEAAAFRYPFVKEQGIVDATIGNHPIAVFAAPGQVIRVFSRVVGSRIVDLSLRHGLLLDRLTGTSWQPASGLGHSGPLAPQALNPVPFATAFDWAWETFYPRTQIVG
jgi:hypothetical protein